MFDGLRGFFETGIVLLFLVSVVCYVIYLVKLAKPIKSELKQLKLSENPQGRKQRKALKHRAINTHLTNPFFKTVYFFADLFWVLFIVVFIRSFFYEPFIIPSKSMKPGLLVSDVVLVNKHVWGIRLPIVDTKITGGDPKRGDVIVFKFPPKPEISYIKRVIGLPGDKIHYDNRTLYINGKKIPLKPTGEQEDSEFEFGVKIDQHYQAYEENIFGNIHNIRYDVTGNHNFGVTDLTVPENSYFVMGDNRDNSADGRAFGFVPEKNIIGKASYIALNFKCFTGAKTCDRFFKTIK